jgi:hypothetical protein
MAAPGNERFEASFGIFEPSFSRAMLQITNGGTVNLEGPACREAKGPQSVRPLGAENYPEPCPREKGTERRCVPEHWNEADWRMTRDGRLLGRHPTVTARPTEGRSGRVAGPLAARLKNKVNPGGPALLGARQHQWHRLMKERARQGRAGEQQKLGGHAAFAWARNTGYHSRKTPSSS